MGSPSLLPGLRREDGEGDQDSPPLPPPGAPSPPTCPPTARSWGLTLPPTPSARPPGSHEEREVQRRTGVGRVAAMQLRCVRGVRAELETWPGRFARPPPSLQWPDRRLPPWVSPDTHCEVKPVTPFCLTGFLDPLMFPRDWILQTPGMCLFGAFLLLLVQTSPLKTADKALCLPPGRIFHEF